MSHPILLDEYDRQRRECARLKAQLDAAHDALRETERDAAEWCARFEFLRAQFSIRMSVEEIDAANAALVGERQPDSVHRPVTSPCPSPLSGDTSEPK